MNYHSWKNLPLSLSQLSAHEIAPWFKLGKQYHKIPPALMEAVMSGESHVNPSTTSPQGAQGSMQLLPGTTDQLQVTNSYDIKANIQASTRYLGFLLNKFITRSLWPWPPIIQAHDEFNKF